VYTSDLVSKLSSDYIAPVACNSKGETGKIQILNNCLVVYTVEDGLPTIMQESSPAPGDITQAPSTDVVYTEVN
jgi:argonaute-like protein implicated in RNA metabolism and viral defense